MHTTQRRTRAGRAVICKKTTKMRTHHTEKRRQIKIETDNNKKRKKQEKLTVGQAARTRRRVVAAVANARAVRRVARAVATARARRRAGRACWILSVREHNVRAHTQRDAHTRAHTHPIIAGAARSTIRSRKPRVADARAGVLSGAVPRARDRVGVLHTHNHTAQN